MAARNIRVIEIREEFLGEVFYVAQALEADIKGIGVTIEEARTNFRINLGKVFAKARPGRDPFVGYPPAEWRFWEIYREYIDSGGTMDPKYW